MFCAAGLNCNGNGVNLCRSQRWNRMGSYNLWQQEAIRLKQKVKTSSLRNSVIQNDVSSSTVQQQFVCVIFVCLEVSLEVERAQEEWDALESIQPGETNYLVTMETTSCQPGYWAHYVTVTKHTPLPWGDGIISVAKIDTLRNLITVRYNLERRHLLMRYLGNKWAIILQHNMWTAFHI